MLSGKKAVAEGILYGALDVIQERFKEDPLEVFRKALDNVKPKLEVKSRRVGGATYQVPVEVRPERRVALAMRWLVTYARDRGEKTMRERLAGELARRRRRPRQRRQEEGRHAQDGRGQQGLRPLPLVRARAAFGGCAMSASPQAAGAPCARESVCARTEVGPAGRMPGFVLDTTRRAATFRVPIAQVSARR